VTAVPNQAGHAPWEGAQASNSQWNLCCISSKSSWYPAQVSSQLRLSWKNNLALDFSCSAGSLQHRVQLANFCGL